MLFFFCPILYAFHPIYRRTTLQYHVIKRTIYLGYTSKKHALYTTKKKKEKLSTTTINFAVIALACICMYLYVCVYLSKSNEKWFKSKKSEYTHQKWKLQQLGKKNKKIMSKKKKNLFEKNESIFFSIFISILLLFPFPHVFIIENMRYYV